MVPQFLCDRVRAAEHAPRGRFYLPERRHGLAEISERGVGVQVERLKTEKHAWHTTLNTVTNSSREWAYVGHEIKDSCAYITGKKK